MKHNLLKNTSLLLSCLLAFSSLFFSCTSKKATKTVNVAAKPEMAANVAPAFETQVLNAVNQYRQSKGLPPFQTNFVITTEARRHSMNMATNRVKFGHTGIAARTKIISSKVAGVKSVAENVAFGNLSAQEVLNTWLGSEGHRKNIEGNYTLTGIGVARNQKSQLYFTEIFAK
jgi:uncharacterized protein YkwD